MSNPARKPHQSMSSTSPTPPKTKNRTELAVVILAAGKGTRMKSALPKVLHKIAGQPMIAHIIKTVESLKPQKIITVIAPDMDNVKQAVAPHPVTIQKQQKGTADAVKSALKELPDFKGQILILYGDVPLVSYSTLDNLLNHHRSDKNFGATVLAMAAPNPTGYGRIFQNADGTLNRIIEEKDASDDEKLVRLVNSGLMVLEGENLGDHLDKIKNKNAQQEFYLVDLPEILAKDNLSTGVIRGDFQELRGINSRTQLAELELAWQHNKRLSIMESGVTLIDPNTVYFSADTVIGRDTIIEQGVIFGQGVTIEDNVEIKAYSHIEGAIIKSGATIGPFARIRPDTIIKEQARIGNFVEVKNSTIGKGAKANHLGYIGDTELGAQSNFGCGAITVNYDGKTKSKTKIGKNVMIGSNSSLIAPIEIGDGAYIAAGSTLTRNVEKDTLVIARAETKSLAGKAKDRMKKE
ncbi:MAG TPA: bifunctional UDP-N-acetylglucosamine diphosphorylase/glucosamine-1-phosphate N-acetyltransferase GlmU [Alphaproteobacteria bacterium]|nr:bifunctional UDP-N-acetylglucosamine diphosphorylase/glucosamine-1-phosphate N-acetyltransferase GlmU [Alphaproteobacteria bacterium]